MYIVFKKVRYKNFLSTGNKFTEIDLTRNSKTLIHGTNGSGKTTFVDAVFFALFGKSFRKVKKDAVVNYITGKHAMVELEFAIRKDEYKIMRGVKPNKFYIYKNDKLIPQESTVTEYQRYLETFILHMNEKLFTQTVLLGSTNYTPFMLLATADRRNVIESLLDIQIFSVMNELAKEESKTLQRKYNNVEYSIEKSDISINHIKDHIDSVEGNRNDLIKNNKTKIEENKKLIDDCANSIKEKEKEHELLMEKRDAVGNKESIKKMINSLENYKSQFENLIHNNEKKIDFYNNNDSCPTCQQDIDEDVKIVQLQEYEKSNKKFTFGIEKALDTISEQKNMLKEYTDIQSDMDDCLREISSLRSNISKYENNIETLEDNIKEIQQNADTSKDEESIKKFIKEKEKFEKDLSKTSKNLINYSTVLDLLKDSGIKSRIVKTYIPVINQLIKKYLDILDFPIVFRFDEGFNEYIKVRGRDEVTFPNLSEGERSRINLALMFSFRELSKLRNATHTNLLIFDEIADSSLDISGWDAFLKILKDICKDGNQNVFVISHKGEHIMSKFDANLKFAKKGGRFSEIITDEV